MKKSIYILGVFALLFSACTSDIEDNDVQNGNQVSLTAYFEQDGSRTLLDGTQVLWESGDEISVFSIQSDNVKFTTMDAGASAKFSGNINNAPAYAVYPYSSSVSISHNPNDGHMNVAVILPETQIYKENSFASGANVAVGKVEGNKIQFKNAMGALKLRLKAAAGEDITIGKLKLIDKAGKFLSGKYTIRVDALPNIIQTAISTSTGQNDVILDCTAANGGAGVPLTSDYKDFFIAIPHGALSGGFKVEAYDMNNVLVNTIETSADATIQRNNILIMQAPALEQAKIQYVPLQYIEATGAQYIDTEFALNQASPMAVTNPAALCFETMAMFTNQTSTSSSGAVFGYDQDGQTKHMFRPFYDYVNIEAGTNRGTAYRYVRSTIGQFTSNGFDNTAPSYPTSYATQWQTVYPTAHDKYNENSKADRILRQYFRFDDISATAHYNSGVFYLNPNSDLDTNPDQISSSKYLYSSGTYQVYQSGGNYSRWPGDHIYLGAVNENGTAKKHLIGRIYRFKIWKYNTSTYYRNYVPMKKIEVGKADEIGLYDEVNEVFKPSATSTPFIAGPEVSPVSNKYNTESFKK